jgi:hypothetical protein
LLILIIPASNDNKLFINVTEEIIPEINETNTEGEEKTLSPEEIILGKGQTTEEKLQRRLGEHVVTNFSKGGGSGIYLGFAEAYSMLSGYSYSLVCLWW